MDENLHNIEDLFRSALDDNEETASSNVWEAIDRRLDQDKIVSIKKEYANLKRIAAMLLFLLISYIMYDAYKIDDTHYEKSMVKNNLPTDSGSQHRLNTIPKMKADDKTSPSNSAAKDHTSMQQKENVVAENINAENIEPVNKKEIHSNQNAILPKQNIVTTINTDKVNSENQTAIILNQKKKLTTSTPKKVKIKNTLAEEDGNILVSKDDKQQYNHIPALRKLKIISIERVSLLQHDSIDTKKLMQLIVNAKFNTVDTSNNTVAKNINEKNARPSRFSFAPFFSPDIAWYRLRDNEMDNQHDNAGEIEKEEKHEFSSTYGALLDFSISKHWGIQSGFTISNTNITVDPKNIYAQQDNSGNIKYRINTSSGYGYMLPSFSNNPVVGDSLYAFTSTHSLQYIGIPLSVVYNFNKGKFRLNTLAGISANILTRAKLETTVEKGFDNSAETVDKLQGLRKVHFSGLAGIGVNYKLNQKTAITFAPTMRFALNSINKDVTVKSYPMSFGFVVGLSLAL